MTPRTGRTIVIALITCMALPAWGQQYLLYTPQRLPSGQKAAAEEGVLVQEVEVRKGDTLYALSRKFGGRGMYYPQILLFNSIKNPNLIYPGHTLRIPVTQKEAENTDRVPARPAGTSPKARTSGVKKTPAVVETVTPAGHSAVTAPASGPSTELSLSDLKTVDTGKSRGSRIKKKTATHLQKKPSPAAPPAVTASSPPPPAAHESAVMPGTASGQKLFEAAVKAYRQDDCRTAIELLDRYLADNADSLLAADATLYKAECYLKLSAQ